MVKFGSTATLPTPGLATGRCRRPIALLKPEALKQVPALVSRTMLMSLRFMRRVPKPLTGTLATLHGAAGLAGLRQSCGTDHASCNGNHQKHFETFGHF